MTLRCELGAEPLPGYRLVARLGGGGFGQVWSARGPGGRAVAVKILHGDLAAADPGRRSAEQELNAVRRAQPVRHPHLLPVERYEVVDGRLVIVTPLANGDLADCCRDCRGEGLPGIPRDELLRYLAEAADALDALRAAGLQHLDVKPENLFLVNGHVAVGDFGLVRELRAGTAGAAASPVYAAPETFAGDVSPHCDQYSLAVVYQEMLTGTRPFAGTTPERLAQQHLTAAPNVAPLPPRDRAAVTQALAKKPGERFSSCAEFIQALHDPTDSEMRVAAGGLENKSEIREPRSEINPALVIAVGGLAGEVLKRLRRALADRLGPADRWPVRLLYVDTDPHATRAAVDGGDLSPAEVLPAPLQRSAHYTKQRIDVRSSGSIGWFDAGLLRRMSPAGTPAGCRGLGRLAFADHVRALGQKVEADLAAVSRIQPGRPRVIVIAGLAGGTGGGMALDIAYLARQRLRAFGDAPSLVGWLLLPPADAADRDTANAYAALAELRHFSKPDTTYKARCDDPPDSLTSKDPPFGDLVVLPLDVEAAADGLARELLAPNPQPQTPVPGQPVCRMFGQARLAWPRRPILRAAARRLAADLVTLWTTTNPSTVEGPVRTWLAEQWSVLGLGPEALAGRLHQAAAAAVGRPVDEALVTTSRLDGLLNQLAAALAAATDGLVRDAGTRLARLAVTLIEQPDFRLAAAAAVVRLLAERIDRSVAHVGPAVDECRRKSDAAMPADRVTAARWRYQGMVLRQLAAGYAVLRRQLHDQMAEVNLCRTKLATVGDALRTAESAGPPSPGLLLPPDCPTVAAAAERVPISPDDVRELDRRIQQHLQDAGGLARTCLTAAELPASLGPPLCDLAATLLEPRLAGGAAELFLAHQPDPAAALKMMRAKAAPVFAAADADVTTVVAPEPLADAARQAFGADIPLTTSADEVAVIRTVPRLLLSALPHLGPEAKAAYQRRKAAGESPHARMDVLILD
jgi:hypothetical protein